MRSIKYLILFVLLIMWNCGGYQNRPEYHYEEDRWVREIEAMEYEWAMIDSIANEETVTQEPAQIDTNMKINKESDTLAVVTRQEHQEMINQFKEKEENQIRNIETLENQNKMMDSLLKKKIE